MRLPFLIAVVDQRSDFTDQHLAQQWPPITCPRSWMIQDTPFRSAVRKAPAHQPWGLPWISCRIDDAALARVVQKQFSALGRKRKPHLRERQRNKPPWRQNKAWNCEYISSAVPQHTAGQIGHGWTVIVEFDKSGRPRGRKQGHLIEHHTRQWLHPVRFWSP